MTIKDYNQLIDTQSFKFLKNWLIDNSSNIFDILNVGNYEIRHSKYLAWLFKNSNLFGLLFNDGNNIKITNVYTEFPVPESENSEKKGRIDILIEAENEAENKKYVYVIENKYGSKIHDKQCQRYKEYISKKYSDSTSKYIFLDIYEPDKKLFEENGELEGYKSLTYKKLLEDMLNDTSFSLQGNANNNFNNEVLKQYKEVIKSNYEWSNDEKEKYNAVLEQEGATEVLLKEYKYDESKSNDCMTIYKLQTYMWDTCLKKGNELIGKIYNKLIDEHKLKDFEKTNKSENTSNNYRVYRCLPYECDDKNLEKLNFGKEYNPIMHIAIVNNLSISDGKKYGINISIELPECQDGKDELRKKLYKTIHKIIGKRYTTDNWKAIKYERIISREEYFKGIFSKEDFNNSIINKENLKKIYNLIDDYINILNNYPPQKQ